MPVLGMQQQGAPTSTQASFGVENPPEALLSFLDLLVYSFERMWNGKSERTPAGMRRDRYLAIVLFVVVCLSATPFALQPKPTDTGDGLNPILHYISTGWDTLTRSMSNCESVVDPKLAEASILYIPAHSPVPDVLRQLQKHCKVEVRELPVSITGPGQVTTNITPPGLLYLENSYVVPGGRFNEMYGWDSYFIVRGLIEDKRVALARGMVENFFYEIEHYGTVLNANRSYFLTRSQPPFLTSMIMAVYEVGKSYAVQVCDVARTMAQPDCEPTREVSLIADYYKGDGAMRESGFDISFRFGLYGAATHHYAPVCLNSLLYKTEKDLQKISEILKHK